MIFIKFRTLHDVFIDINRNGKTFEDIKSFNKTASTIPQIFTIRVNTMTNSAGLYSPGCTRLYRIRAKYFRNLNFVTLSSDNFPQTLHEREYNFNQFFPFKIFRILQDVIITVTTQDRNRYEINCAKLLRIIPSDIL